MNDIYVPKLLEFPFKKNMFITGDEQIELLIRKERGEITTKDIIQDLKKKYME